MKKRLLVVAALIVTVITLCTVFSGAATVPDPSDNYVVQTAPNEDGSISMWFEHSFKKVMTSDVTPSGMNTYSVYMAKNEIESAQFVLYSDTTYSGMDAQISTFTDSNGNTLEAEVYYQMYVTLNELLTDAVYGATKEDTIIREGEQPEIAAPLDSVAGGFRLNAGKSQAFYIRVKSTEDTVPGWYSAQLNILNKADEVVKTATVYTYVWDFTLSEKTALQTSFYVNNTNLHSAGVSYQDAYDYFLENRLNAMDIPGAFNSDNPYLTNDRVAAIRVSPGVANGSSAPNAYLNQTGAFSTYADLYNDISNMKEWEDIKNKFYFYVVDEAMSAEQQDALGKGGATVDDVKSRYASLNQYWPNPNTVLPYHENHPYPYYTYGTTPISSLQTNQFKDGLQEMLETDTVQIFCPQFYAFTPLEVLDAADYTGLVGKYTSVRSTSATISGSLYSSERYYNWEKLYGEFADRVLSDSIVKNAEEGREDNHQLWTYSAGWNKSYTYCNHLIENTGLQTKMLFWQLFQNDITGYLYYGTNNWTEYDGDNGGYIDKTTTGAKTVSLKVNKHVYSAANIEGGHSIFGNGVLFYPANNARLKAENTDYGLAGTVRVELMRDGIEEYQMLTMLEELKGTAAADAVVDSVSTNVACYLSLNGFDRSAFDSSMDEYDIMAMVRRNMGNEIEAASAEACDHKYGEGKVTTAATCKTMGEMTYTCTKCGAEKIENIPTLHAQGDCFEVTQAANVSCTSDTKEYLRCTICGYEKYVTVKAAHNDPAHYIYSKKSNTAHEIKCDVCDQLIETTGHSMWTVYTNTCTEAGTINEECRYCDHVVVGEAIEAHGHNLRDGKCTACDYSEKPTIPPVEVVVGDITGDGNINIADMFELKRFVMGQVQLDETQMQAANINGDDTVNLVDLFAVKTYLATGSFN